MLAGDVLSFAAHGGTVQRCHVGRIAAALRPRKGGGAVIAVERGFALEDPDGRLILLEELWSDAEVRMNDGGCDPNGRFLCGSMAYDQRAKAGSLYRLDPDGTVHLVLQEVTVSNGLDFSPHGDLVYYVDSATQEISVFDYHARKGWMNRRTFVPIPRKAGIPDGLTVDAEGGVWVALAGGGAVHRYTPGGVLDEVIEVPAKNVTACTFGGENLDRLYITTSREGLEPGDDPLAGSLFSVVPGMRGQPAREFAG